MRKFGGDAAAFVAAPLWVVAEYAFWIAIAGIGLVLMFWRRLLALAAVVTAIWWFWGWTS
jgi:hypothetical protein